MSLIIGAAAETPDEEQDQPVEHEDDEENGEEFGQLVLNDGDDVVAPVMLDCFDHTYRFILRGHGQKVHDYGVSLSGCC
jgi:hypothetical protein